MAKKKPKQMPWSKPKPKKSRKKKVLVGMGVGSLVGAAFLRRPPK